MNFKYIKREDVLNISYYGYGVPFTGSYKQMRYRIERDPLEKIQYLSKEEKENAFIKVYTWYKDLAFDKIDKDDITVKKFAYCEEGMLEAVSYLNDCYDDVLDK